MCLAGGKPNEYKGTQAETTRIAQSTASDIEMTIKAMSPSFDLPVHTSQIRLGESSNITSEWIVDEDLVVETESFPVIIHGYRYCCSC